MPYDSLCDLVGKIAEILPKIDSEKGTQKRSLQKQLRFYAKSFLEYLPEGNARGLFVFYLFYFSHTQFDKFHRYVESLYLSKDYEFFRDLRPIDAARYARYYLARRGTGPIDQRFLPALIKHARLVKERIRGRIKYQRKLNPLLPPEKAFCIVKEKHKQKHKLPKLRYPARKRRPSKNSSDSG